MKKKGLVYCSLGLALGLGLGVVGVVNANKNVREAKATGEVRVYLDMGGFANWYSGGAAFKFHTWNSTEGDQFFEMTKISDAYYYVDVNLETYASGGGDSGYEFRRYKSDYSEEWNRGSWHKYSSGASTYYRATGWSAGDWSNADQKTWKVVGATDGDWEGGDEDIDISLTMRFNNEGLSYYSTTVNLTKGSVFKVENVTDSAYYGYNAIETGAGSVIADSAVSGEGSGNITVEKTGSYEVYMKPFSGKFWMQENSEASATAFATEFLSTTGTICSAEGDHTSALVAKWNAKAVDPDGTSLVEKWNALTLGAKNAFAAGTANATLVSAKARYLHIISVYSASLTAFEGGPTVAPGAIQSSVNVETANVAPIAITVTAVTLAAVAGVFFLRKRKQDR